MDVSMRMKNFKLTQAQETQISQTVGSPDPANGSN